MSSIELFFQLQLDRIKGKPQAHAPGPKKPELEELDAIPIKPIKAKD